MWYEALPPIIIIGIFSAIPFHVAPYINKFFIGNPNLRNYDSDISHLGYTRDFEQNERKLWKFNGLDAIPDK
ncbi:uncharacterized protein LOC108622886 [Ceratina calcarata]|uniref:Uncharacterized protein LOC108622886 n=1 Tax=Ceratina calcarata TaxID=156304 RepID=A0AAJ7ITX1_9HYME|nr:uncharacterized protein LOC108622886 [Ceratina calcarata]